MRLDLAGRRALVTGASSDGLGAHFARVLAACGADVVATARRLAPLQDLAAGITAAGGKATALAMDVTDAGSVAAAISRAGPIDILINNAGVELMAGVLDHTEADYDRVVDTNLKGAWLVATAVARGMRDRAAGGSIVNIASIIGLRPMGQAAPYAMSKAGVIHLTRQMAMELARHRIRVNALAPGFVATDMNRAYLETEAGQTLVKRVPMRRLGRPEELDGPLLLLASDAGSFMTGSVIAVDGGHLVNSL